MSSHPKGHQNADGGAVANQQQRARPAAPPSSSSDGSAEYVDGRRVVEFEINGKAGQLMELLRASSQRGEKVHLKLTSKEKLAEFEWFSYSPVVQCVGSVDLAPLSDVVEVPSEFLFGYKGLESVDLAPLGNVTQIGDFFLHESGVSQLDLSPLRNVQSVGESFLHSVKSLRTINLSPLSKLTSIPDSMLYECKNLTSVNLQGLNQVQKIGGGFCFECHSLRHLDFSDMKSVTDIDDAFCCGARHLESIVLSGFGNVQRTGNDFLSYCPRLKHLDLSAMQNLEEVGSCFLSQPGVDERVKSSLKSINLSGLRKLKKIDSWFLEGCCNLTHFLAECTSLKEINMKGLIKLSTVGSGLLSDALSLEHLDLSGCVSLTHVGELCCCGCSSLQLVNFTSVEKVSEIEDPDTFFEECPKLSAVIGLPDCIRDQLPKEHPVRKHGQRYWKMFPLLIRERSRGHAYDAFQVWNVMRFVAEYL